MIQMLLTMMAHALHSMHWTHAEGIASQTWMEMEFVTVTQVVRSLTIVLDPLINVVFAMELLNTFDRAHPANRVLSSMPADMSAHQAHRDASLAP